MVYTIYETNCIVFDIKNSGEDDCLIKAFSDKFGIINIIAKSFRKSTSKLKSNIKPFSINRIAIVKGKEFFRLTDTENLFVFSGSKSIVQFLRIIEDLFWSDERDYFDDINTDIYNMIIHLCKLIIYIVKNGNQKVYLNMINMFFTVYIRGLQGFTDKLDISEMKRIKDDELLKWLENNQINIADLYKKIKI